MTTVSACPYCHTADTVNRLIDFSIPIRTTYTNRSAQLLQCEHCQQVFMSMYEEESADQVKPAAWNAYFYYLPQALQHDLLIDATLCLAPGNSTCTCAAHHLISELDFSQLQKLP